MFICGAKAEKVIPRPAEDLGVAEGVGLISFDELLVLASSSPGSFRTVGPLVQGLFRGLRLLF